MAEHSKGPWSHDGGSICDADGKEVAILGEPPQWSGEGFHTFDNYQANGQLMAASPTLLDALEGVIAELEDMYFATADTKVLAQRRIENAPCLIAARAAITLATGKDA